MDIEKIDWLIDRLDDEYKFTHGLNHNLIRKAADTLRGCRQIITTTKKKAMSEIEINLIQNLISTGEFLAFSKDVKDVDRVLTQLGYAEGEQYQRKVCVDGYDGYVRVRYKLIK